MNELIKYLPAFVLLVMAYLLYSNWNILAGLIVLAVALVLVLKVSGVLDVVGFLKGLFGLGKPDE